MKLFSSAALPKPGDLFSLIPDKKMRDLVTTAGGMLLLLGGRKVLALGTFAKGLKASRRAGAEVRFQPPYSPEFNPIELTWSFLTHVVRKLRAASLALLRRAVWRALMRVTSRHLEGWFRHSGYRVHLK